MVNAILGELMKSIETQLSRYKSVHFNKKNIQTHFVGIPLIVLSVTLLLNLISFELVVDSSTISFSLAMVIFAFVACYYFALHRLLALGMLGYIVFNLMVAQQLQANYETFGLAIFLFMLGWIIQFIGHYYEKAKPAFVDDLSQFLIGPLFLMAEIYFYLGWLSALEKAITPLAIKQRRVLEAEKN